MSFISQLLAFKKKQDFQPNFWGIFLNANFFTRRALYKSIRRIAPTLEGLLLDFGCGRKPYRNLFKVQEYIGLDIEQSGHEHSDSQVDVFYDGKKIPFEEGHFDVVFSSEVFEHVFNLDEVLGEIHRVLKPHGILFATVPFVWEEHEVPYDFGRYTTYGLAHLLNQKGFEVIKIEKSGHYMEVIFQMWINYLYNLLPGNPKVKNLLTIFIVSPFTLLGIFWAWILPKKDLLYSNNVVLARKL